MDNFKYFVWKYYLRQETGWIGTHIAAGPRIIVTMIVSGIIQVFTGFYYTPWYEILVWVLLGLQIWLSFDLCGLGYYRLFPITYEELIEFEERFENEKKS